MSTIAITASFSWIAFGIGAVCGAAILVLILWIFNAAWVRRPARAVASTVGYCWNEITLTRRRMIFFYDLAQIALLAFIAFLYVNTAHFTHFGRSIAFLRFLSFPERYHLLFTCMWMGAMGGVMISLKGVYEHSHSLDPWKNSYNLWHIGRPISGAIAGVIVALLYLLIVPTEKFSPLVLYGVAFIFGTQDAAFFDFLSTFAGRFLPKSEHAGMTGVQISAVSPPLAGAGAVLTVQGQGFQGDAVLKVGSEPVDHPTVSPDGKTVSGHVPTIPGVPVGRTKIVDVVVANVDGSSAALAGKFTYQG